MSGRHTFLCCCCCCGSNGCDCDGSGGCGYDCVGGCVCFSLFHMSKKFQFILSNVAIW